MLKSDCCLLQSEERSSSPPAQYGSKPQFYIDDDQIAAMLKQRPFDKATGKRSAS